MTITSNNTIVWVYTARHVPYFLCSGMYSVVEFAEEWLTPGKQRCLWPPQKLMTKFAANDDDYEAYTGEKNRTYRKQVTSSVQSTPVSSKSQKQHSRPVYTELNKSDDDTDLSKREDFKESSAKTTDSEMSQLLQSPNVIAKHLARIEADLKEMQIAQNEILNRVRSSSVSMEHSLPGERTLPCEDSKDLIDTEKWINAAPENRKLLTQCG
ncbi:uncharacterized protein LOC125240903 isoform X3 [Leguminivora glycinivorella]|uniref:uncharacterized protein LOC125240903 isoform X3 n=1 Tax=Leguminivora glycinivorella TaxID=1035111 RepID=UPI00200FF287|nr:uncharacterized protein LOC125240903 isoform X3 [Leguminivora glycinivorella]